MKKFTSLGIGMGIILACTAVPVSACCDSYNNYAAAYGTMGAFGLVNNGLSRITTLPGYTPRPVPRPPKVPSVLDIRTGSLRPVRVGDPSLDKPSG